MWHNILNNRRDLPAVDEKTGDSEWVLIKGVKGGMWIAMRRSKAIAGDGFYNHRDHRIYGVKSWMYIPEEDV